MKSERRNWTVIIADAVARDLSLACVAHEQNVSKAMVCQTAKRLGVTLRADKVGQKTIVTEAVMLEAAEAGLGCKEVARTLGVSRQAVRKAQYRYGVFLRRGVGGQPRGR